MDYRGRTQFGDELPGRGSVFEIQMDEPHSIQWLLRGTHRRSDPVPWFSSKHPDNVRTQRTRRTGHQNVGFVQIFGSQKLEYTDAPIGILKPARFSGVP